MNDTVSRSNSDLFMNDDLIVTFLWMTLYLDLIVTFLWTDTVSRSNCDLFYEQHYLHKV